MHRTTRKLSLTEEGRSFHLRCKVLLGELDEAELEITAHSTRASGLVKINVPVSFGILHLAPLWSGFMAQHPKVTLDIQLADRLVDLVEGVSRQGNEVCARAYQAAVACVDTVRGAVTWRRAAAGTVGLHGDDRQVYGVEGDGRVLAWQRANGEPVWTSDRLRYRNLSAPLVLVRSVVIGDGTGLVHFLSRADGTSLTRLTTDGSAIGVTPVVAGGTLVVVTQQGGIYGFQPE